MQQILELLGNCSDIIGGMYPDIPWPTPGSDTGDAGGGSDNGDAGGGSDNGDAGSGDDTTGGWIDPGSGSMDDLSDNLQQIVRLLGQMTDVFTSDAVIEDMQNVLSQLMNVSSAIMSMAYSLGNAPVQLEDISDTDDDDDDEKRSASSRSAPIRRPSLPIRMSAASRETCRSISPLTERINSTFPPR